jgi:hypothetical protein
MLTTEKLFRGDTEFALMEKVRKAEVDPPSKFNRRVTPELDKIVLKALARDVTERYQTAAELHADLKGLLEGYRFDLRELREFMRKEFRAEYLKEEEENQQALTALPMSERPVRELEDEPVTAVTSRKRLTEPTSPPAHAPSPPIGASATPPPSPVVEVAPAAPPEAQPGGGGFWSSLFRKKR